MSWLMPMLWLMWLSYSWHVCLRDGGGIALIILYASEWRAGQASFGPVAVTTARAQRCSQFWNAPVPIRVRVRVRVQVRVRVGVRVRDASLEPLSSRVSDVQCSMRACGQPHLSSLIGKRAGLLVAFWWFCLLALVSLLLPLCIAMGLSASASPLRPLRLVGHMLASASASATWLLFVYYLFRLNYLFVMMISVEKWRCGAAVVRPAAKPIVTLIGITASLSCETISNWSRCWCCSWSWPTHNLLTLEYHSKVFSCVASQQIQISSV